MKMVGFTVLALLIGAMFAGYRFLDPEVKKAIVNHKTITVLLGAIIALLLLFSIAAVNSTNTIKLF